LTDALPFVGLQEEKKTEEKPKEEVEAKKEDKPKEGAEEEKPKDEKPAEGEGGDKPKEGEEAAPPPPPPPPEEVEMRVYMHCEGCARKVKKILKRFDGNAPLPRQSPLINPCSGISSLFAASGFTVEVW
jgi:hypothetical protein